MAAGRRWHAWIAVRASHRPFAPSTKTALPARSPSLPTLPVHPSHSYLADDEDADAEAEARKARWKHFRPGQLSTALRNALDIGGAAASRKAKPNGPTNSLPSAFSPKNRLILHSPTHTPPEYEAPPYIQRLQILGYPPGWRDPEALAQHTRGGGLLAMYMTSEAAEEEDAPLPVGGNGMAVRYPGFNAPLRRAPSPDKPHAVDMDLSDDEQPGPGPGTSGHIPTQEAAHAAEKELAIPPHTLATDRQRHEALLELLRAKDTAAALEMLEAQPHLAAQPDVLHVASSCGLTAVVRRLLEDRQVDVDGRSAAGDTALHLAAFGGHAEIVKALIAAGANVHATTPEGATAMVLAGTRDDIRVILDWAGGER